MSEPADLVTLIVNSFVETVDKGGAFQDRRIFPINYNNLRVMIVNNLVGDNPNTQQVTYLDAMQKLRETFGGAYNTYLSFSEALQVVGFIKNPETRIRSIRALVELHRIHLFKTPQHFQISVVNGTVVSTEDYHRGN